MDAVLFGDRAVNRAISLEPVGAAAIIGRS
jgi:hypothetical protein